MAWEDFIHFCYDIFGVRYSYLEIKKVGDILIWKYDKNFNELLILEGFYLKIDCISKSKEFLFSETGTKNIF